ncbi:MAG: ABC transporter substrate-binding protein [Candidatus Rokubacteria bacterium]|nr:ABC transporter substrate-binding protein [Candidatus Rokubacteria bacterium]
MKRGTLILIVSFALWILWTPLSADAQPSRKVPRIGVLAAVPASFAGPYVEAGRQAMRELGYVEGQNIAIDYRFAEGKPEQLPDLAAQLVALSVDVIVVVGDRGVHAAKRATSTIPIVMVSAGDPVRDGFVSSLARPGGNITGFSSLLPELNAKQLGLLKEAVPRASRLAVLWNPASSGGVLGFREMQSAAPTLGIKLQSLEVRTPEQIEPAFSAMVNERADGFIVLTDPLTFRNRKRIVALAAKHRLPAIYEVREFVDDGALMSYGPSLIAMIRRAPVYVDKILKGARPADLPVEQPTRFEFVVNLKTARALDLAIPQSVLLRADHVIQ